MREWGTRPHGRAFRDLGIELDGAFHRVRSLIDELRDAFSSLTTQFDEVRESFQ